MPMFLANSHLKAQHKNEKKKQKKNEKKKKKKTKEKQKLRQKQNKKTRNNDKTTFNKTYYVTLILCCLMGFVAFA